MQHTTLTGSDYLGSFSLKLQSNLTSGLGALYKIPISPDSFKATRLELLSNCFQYYRFLDIRIKYKPSLTSSINGMLIGYIDTDPLDDASDVVDADSLIKVAKSHYGSVQGVVNKPWTVIMPQYSKNKWFYTGNKGSDVRLKQMGVFYLYQVGPATKYDGSKLTEELFAGSLTVEWKVAFKYPQLQFLNRIYDGNSLKNQMRIHTNPVTWFKDTSGNITSTQVIGGSRFRQFNVKIPTNQFMSGNGNYLVRKIPISLLQLPDSVKSINSLTESYSKFKYNIPGTDIWSRVVNNIISSQEAQQFLENNFGLLGTGFKVAKQFYDGLKLQSPLYNSNSSVGTLTNITINDPNSDISKSLPDGSTVVHFDGTNAPVIQNFVEFKDNAHAADNAISFVIPTQWSLQKLDGTEIIEPSLAYLKA